MSVFIFNPEKMTLLLIALLLSLKIQLGYSQHHATKDISCDHTIKTSPWYHYEITCQDFSSPGYTNGELLHSKKISVYLSSS